MYLDFIDHRMIWVGSNHIDHLVPSSNSPAVGRDTFQWTNLLQAPFHLALNTSREGAATASLGNLIVKNFFLISNLNLPSFQFKATTPCLITTGPSKKSLSSFCVGPLQVLEGCPKVSPEPSLLQDEQPQLSQPFLIGEVFHPPDHFFGPPLDPL